MTERGGAASEDYFTGGMLVRACKVHAPAICVCVCMYLCTHVCIYVCIYVCMYVHEIGQRCPEGHRMRYSSNMGREQKQLNDDSSCIAL